jgi:hypothetical protein
MKPSTYGQHNITSGQWITSGLFFKEVPGGAGTHKRGKDKHTESFVTISLYNITVYYFK